MTRRSPHYGLVSFFDYEQPPPSAILSGAQENWNYLTQGPVSDVLERILTHKNGALILPNGYSELLLQAPGVQLDRCRENTKHLPHWRQAPWVALNDRLMTTEGAESTQFTLGSAFQSMAVCPEYYTTPHRGLVVIDPLTKTPTLYPFVYLVEALVAMEHAKGLIKRTTRIGIDVIGEVPSLDNPYATHRVTLKNVPLLASPNPYVLGASMYPICSCEWSQYGSRRITDGAEDFRMHCAHSLMLYRALLQESSTGILNVLPTFEGIEDVFLTLKERTLVDGKKLTKTQMNALLGMLILYKKAS